MTDRKRTGNQGEDLACDHLRARGYLIEARNYRYRRWEIDIVARSGDMLVFVEVKTRSSVAFGDPSRFFGREQRRHIANAAGAYMEETGHDWEIRFDCISVYLPSTGQAVIDHVEDAFFPGLF